MEWIWYIIAALGAGIGTGLAGLSAATVMVPILIVLCPSFAGETGAYQATAIALASDILGSAVTTYTYAKHKNIDLKRGWIMLVCILGMCTAGSYVAFLVGNVVLGGFTLFLTFFIGIRFLVKPDTSRKNTAGKGEKLDWKGVAISLFFGLTIGFGTGFVGTGGGMMMLVVAMDAFQTIPFSFLRYKNKPLRFASLKLLFIFNTFGEQSNRGLGDRCGPDSFGRGHAASEFLAADIRCAAGRADTDLSW